MILVAGLLFGSGMCALIYQMVWLREFRFVFGASTLASAAVLSVFLGGLGAGGFWFGRRVDRNPRPLALYAYLELFIAASAALTPLLVWMAREFYVALGGVLSLGPVVATLVRLVLTACALAVPTFLMGGTLPAAARAVGGDEDAGRRRVAVLYGINTLGAVTGALLATFALLERLGADATLWAAAVLNAVVGGCALWIARAYPAVFDKQVSVAQSADGEVRRSGYVRLLIFATAAVVGMAFLLMELVWYRMLAPLLGGTTYTFGLILAVALLGIGLGGTAYALWGRKRPPALSGLALTCILEALCVAIPFALGDQLAVLAGGLREWGTLGFGGLVLSWSVVVGIVVLPTAIVAGYQFPLLIALLGPGARQLGLDVGWTYAWNTLGAILGALLGGFALLPWLSAPGAWQLVVVLLAVLGGGIAAFSWARDRREGESARWVGLQAGIAVVLAVVAASLLLATGPTAAWRHTPIGAGLKMLANLNANGIRGWMQGQRRAVRWEREGIESSVAIRVSDRGPVLFLNGKSEGSAVGDASTQIMSGMIGAILHPQPRNALVIGLGTGSTAGWLAAIDAMERVDVVELEGAVVEAASAFGPVNVNAVGHPKVHTVVGDGREVVLTTRQSYDLIFSEPSNPYRAGVASLYTREFYEGIAPLLRDGGLFAQWVQMYEVDEQTIRTIYATLSSVFAHVETWQTQRGDLLLLSSAGPVSYDVSRLRARIAEEPYRSALAAVWRTADLEGFLAHYVAGPTVARELARGQALNTDDRTLVEYAFARHLGLGRHFNIETVEKLARDRGEDRLRATGGDVDWDWVADQRLAFLIGQGEQIRPNRYPDLTPHQRYRLRALAAWWDSRSRNGLAWWQSQPRQPRGLHEVSAVAYMMAVNQREEAAQYIEQLRLLQPVEADVVLAILRTRQGRMSEAVAALESAFAGYGRDPWAWPALMQRGLALAVDLGGRNAAHAERLYAALRSPFVMDYARETRLNALLNLGYELNFPQNCIEVLNELEPHVPWKRDLLEARVKCYQAGDHPYLDRARRDFEKYLALEEKLSTRQ
ncbi:MAG: spermidine synthase [Gemmatimonadota bacterium]|nr:spermidine synthase [Gemmatimonadota bacterium]